MRRQSSRKISLRISRVLLGATRCVAIRLLRQRDQKGESARDFLFWRRFSLSRHGLRGRNLLWKMNHLEHWLRLALWFAGIGHFCILFASFQVPVQLGWKKDLAQLTA